MTTGPLQLFDALPAHIEDALRASIRRFGVLVPVVKDQNGRIIDGHHRSRIADEEGVKYRVDVMRVSDEDEAREIARHLNARRRHLSGDQLKDHIVMLAQITAADGTGKLSQHEIARVAGVTQPYVSKVLADTELITSNQLPESRRGADGKVRPANRPTIVAAKNEREAERAQEALALIPETTGRVYDVKRIERIARETAAELRRAEPTAAQSVHGNVDIRHGDFRTALADLAGTVDAIITDPPYPKLYDDLWEPLGEVARLLLKPSGVLAVMCGTRLELLYRAEEAIGKRMRRRWMGVYLTPGQRWRDQLERVATGWKPILIYSHPDGDADQRRWINDDVFTSTGTNEADQRFHHWGQNESGFAELVGRLSEPGALVVDPFLGGGTTAVVCRDLGRRFAGCDIDAAAVATSRERVR